jgi:protein-disulfide isomerase
MANESAQPGANPVTHERLLVPVSDRDHTRGAAGAASELVVYGDYECPYTRAVHVAVGRLQPRLGASFRYAYRHFPLRPIHPHAQHAAEAAEVAGLQRREERFWAMHDHLFRHQDALEDVQLAAYAVTLGLDAAAFSEAMQARAGAGRVDEDLRSGLANGVRGTPTLFINGQRYHGPRDVGALETALQSGGSGSRVP